MSEHAGENCGKLCNSYILSSKRGMTPSKIDTKGRHSNLLCSKNIKTKSCVNFQLNMSEHLEEECGKLCISYILSSQRGITPSKIDAK